MGYDGAATTNEEPGGEDFFQVRLRKIRHAVDAAANSLEPPLF